MLNEVQECNGYLAFSKTDALSEELAKEAINDKGLVRALKILARHYWYYDFRDMDEINKINKVADKLEGFLQLVAIENARKKNRILSSEELNKRLEMYKKPVFEYTSHFYTFYSVIADAVNDGPLCGSYDDTKKCPWTEICPRYNDGPFCVDEEKTILLKSELIYLLRLASVANEQLKVKYKPSAYKSLLIGDPIVNRIAALIVYYRCYADKYAVNDGYIPVNIHDLNSWLGSKYLEKGKIGQDKWVSVYSFVELFTRVHTYGGDDKSGSYFLYFSEAALRNGVAEMIETQCSNTELNTEYSAKDLGFDENKLTEAITVKIKELRKNPAMQPFLNAQ